MQVTQFTPYLGKTGNNVIHRWAFRLIFLGHVGDKWFNESKAALFLTLIS